MLVQFRAENHRSLRDEQTLSMVAAETIDPADPRLLRPGAASFALVPVAALYGANASGKSNILDAFDFMRRAVLGSHRLWEPSRGVVRDPFALSSKALEPSRYEVDIIAGGLLHSYGFVLGTEEVDEEWLYAWPGGQEQMWFERERGTFTFGAELAGENELIRRITRTNSLFLSAAAQNNHPSLSPLFRWFSTAASVTRRSPLSDIDPIQAALLGDLFSSQLSLFPEINEAQDRDREAIVHLLRAADVGILAVRVAARDRPAARLPGRGGARTPIEIELRHDTDDAERAWLPLAAESAGTKMLLEIASHLVPILRSGSFLYIDELEASLHPMLARELIRLFQDPRHNPHGAQLLFSTHDTNLLGNNFGGPLFRRDQIWFTEKDKSGATHLYPLSDFVPKEQENLERGYLQGRYGSVPFLGQLVAAMSTSPSRSGATGKREDFALPRHASSRRASMCQTTPVMPGAGPLACVNPP